MFKYLCILMMLFMTGCAVQEQQTKSRSERLIAETDKNNITSTENAKKAEAVTVKRVLYKPSVQSYVDSSSKVQKLRTVAGNWAQNTISENCTLEKFVSGINAPQAEFEKISDNELIIKTSGTKLGAGELKIDIRGNTAIIVSAIIGKISQKDPYVLKKMAMNICQSVDDK